MIPPRCSGTLLGMKSTSTTSLVRPSLLLLALCCTSGAAQAGEPLELYQPFALGEKEYTAGVRLHGLDEDTRVVGWKLSDNLYFGRRKGEIDDFGFVLTRGDTQYSLTEDGIGWRKSVSLFR